MDFETTICTCDTPAPEPEPTKAKKSKGISLSSRSSLTLPVGRFNTYLKNWARELTKSGHIGGGGTIKLFRGASVYITASLEYIIRMVITLAVRSMIQHGEHRLQPYHLACGIHSCPGLLNVLQIAEPARFEEHEKQQAKLQKKQLATAGAHNHHRFELKDPVNTFASKKVTHSAFVSAPPPSETTGPSHLSSNTIILQQAHYQPSADLIPVTTKKRKGGKRAGGPAKKRSPKKKKKEPAVDLVSNEDVDFNSQDGSEYPALPGIEQLLGGSGF